ncbi:GYDIA family GHMP kinase [Litoribaculum gwangyangense]|uniref:GYDIA family GHMP kinase n=1 Tax=Litoribaculum gwangyangense TaxID=1130722 RepID=A0ABP9CV37_9FLAO
MNKRFYSNGKLLLTGEYVVLDGALSLAVATKYGQSLTIEEIDGPKIIWQSLDEKSATWFEETFSIKQITSLPTPQEDISNRLFQILNAAKQLNPKFLDSENGFKITTQLDFPRNWGLGTSSTLVNNIAQWANIDAFSLLKNSFSGSGYDIACAQHNKPITYQLKDKKPIVKEVDFNPSFKNYLYFVHLNKKQNSREGIEQYHSNKENAKFAISEINDITTKILESNTFENFRRLIDAHEAIISKITKQVSVKQLLFDDFEGSIKSLGAWGGDFVLATSEVNPTDYFKKRGFKTVVCFDDMVL